MAAVAPESRGDHDADAEQEHAVRWDDTQGGEGDFTLSTEQEYDPLLAEVSLLSPALDAYSEVLLSLDDATLFELGWLYQRGPRGGHLWVHTQTGAKVYRKTAPVDREAGGKSREDVHGLIRDQGHAEPLHAAHMASAKRGYRTLKRLHGAELISRLHQLAQGDLEMLKHARNDGEKDLLRKRILGYAHMLGWHQDDETQEKEQHAASKRGIQVVKTQDLHADPERFQYKMGTQGPFGVGEELKGTKRFRPEFAGVVLVWHDPAAGKDFVVNGHHRYELAHRTGTENLAVHYIDAPDAKHARAVGVLANIAEGRGTAIDAAKFMRDTGATAADFEREGISLKGALARDATLLAGLSDGLFRKLTLEQIKPSRALAIARELTKHQDQDLLDSVLTQLEQKGKKATDAEVEEMAREIASAPRQEQTTRDLFGSYTEDRSLFLERNQLKAGVLDALGREANTFGAVSSEGRAERLQAGGNVINAERNRELAQDATRLRNTFKALVNYKGKVSDAIDAAAEELAANPRRRNEIQKRLLDTVRQAVLEEAGGVELAASHAPKGGITIAGKPFAGGEFIPSDVVEQASTEERARLEERNADKGGSAASKKKGKKDKDAKQEDKEEEKPEWDGVIDEGNIQRQGQHQREIDTWSFYQGRYESLGTVEINTANYDPDPDDPDAELIKVYRWETYTDDGPGENGEWTADRDEALRDGRRYARDQHEEPPEDEDEEDNDGGEVAYVAEDEGDIPAPEPPKEWPKKEKPAKTSAPVTLAGSVDEDEADTLVHELFAKAYERSGNDSSEAYEAMITSLGLPQGAEATVIEAGKYKTLFSDDHPLRAKGVRVEVKHPHFRRYSRFIGMDADGKRFILNEIIELKEEYQKGGAGTEIFARQVEYAAEEGFDYIRCHAAGSADSSMNGYYTWPRLGYNESLSSIAKDSPDMARKIRKRFPEARSIQDVMLTAEGRDWWKANGEDLFRVRFDLREGSWSRYKLDSYLAEKQAAKKGASNA